MVLISKKLEEHAKNQPYALAIISEIAMLNYKILNHLVWQSALWLHQNGVQANSRVGLSFNNQMTHMVASLALLRLGAAQISLPAGEPEAVREKIVLRTKISVIVSDFSEENFGLQRLLLALPAMMDSKAPVAYHLCAQDQDMVAQVVIGSGTTAVAKAFSVTYQSMTARIHHRLATLPILPQERYFRVANVDFFSTKQSNLACLVAGGTVVLRESKETSILSICDRLAVDHLALTVVQAQRLLERGRSVDQESPRLPRLKTLSVGTSSVTDEIFYRLQKNLCPYLYIRYGTNEFGGATSTPLTYQNRIPGSVGKPEQGVEIEIVDEQDQPCATGTVGIIRMRGPGMFNGYEDNPGATAKALRNGWYYPGDVGQFDPQGELIFRGRADDLIIFEGVNIYPREIEEVLEQHPAVLEAAVFPLTIKGSQVPAAAVRVSEQVSEQALLEFCKKHINWRAPGWILFMDEFPRNAAGKILKREIREMFHQKLLD
ncbi:MAG: hypothetical protein DRR42_11270 [Gammaproteobacteria bacterium]|nr:MAG: hypothetical protein DRR42_11270 [Gammaproteobacteria bacterium]